MCPPRSRRSTKSSAMPAAMRSTRSGRRSRRSPELGDRARDRDGALDAWHVGMAALVMAERIDECVTASSGACAENVGREDIPEVKGSCVRDAEMIERDLEDARVRLLEADFGAVHH